MISCCFITAFSNGLIGCTTGCFVQPVCRELNYDVGSFSLGQTFHALFMVLAQPISGRFFRRYDMRIVSLVSGIVYFLCEFLFGFINNIYLYYLIISIMGIAAGFYCCSSLTIIICRWFKSKTAFALGIMASCSTIMGVIANPLISYLIELCGWRNTYMCMAIIGLLCTIPFSLLLVSYPKDKGIHAYQIVDNEEEEITFKCKYKQGRTVRIVTVLFIVSSLANCVGGYYKHLASFATTINLKNGAFLASCELLGVTLFKYLLDPLLERWGMIKLELFMFALTLFGFLAYFMFDNWILFITTSLCGIFSASNSTTLSVFAREQIGEDNFEKIVLLLSTTSTTISTASTTLFGYMYDWTKSYTPMFVFCIFAITLSIICILMIKYLEKNEKCI